MAATHNWTFHYCEAGKWSILFIQFNSRWKEKPLCCNLLYSDGCKHSVLVVKQTSTLVEVKFEKHLKEDSSAKNITELYNELDHIQVLDSRKKYWHFQEKWNKLICKTCHSTDKHDNDSWCKPCFWPNWSLALFLQQILPQFLSVSFFNGSHKTCHIRTKLEANKE